MLALFRGGHISADEAVSAAPPAFLMPVLAAMSQEQATDARITWASMTSAQRRHPLIKAGAEALGLTDSEVDNLFALARTL